MGEVMFTTVFLFASAIAAKSGRICTGAPAAATPAGEGAVAPCAACEDGCAFACGSEGLEQPLAMNSAASKETASFIGSLSSNGSGLDGHNDAPFNHPGKKKETAFWAVSLGKSHTLKGRGMALQTILGKRAALVCHVIPIVRIAMRNSCGV